MKNEEARVHFIPTLKDGVFVTLCAPLVIKTFLLDDRLKISCKIQIWNENKLRNSNME
ncbi:hypothetical protein [Methanosarcina mazei]|uniref:hypothetical protein n=1 Tax=Methanosarcina mazei TaxID=2209 RepID=UPI0012D4A70B|nr:hypothetical protein [Methanosarcina mazei]